MKTTTEKVYHCEHCKKHMLSAASMSRHEKYCRYNPLNKHKCFDLCRFLVSKRQLKEGGDPSNPGSYIRTFTCEKTGQKMYSYLAIKKMTSYLGNPIKIAGLVRMPLSCNDYQYMTEAQYDERFGTSDIDK